MATQGVAAASTGVRPVQHARPAQRPVQPKRSETQNVARTETKRPAARLEPRTGTRLDVRA